MWQPWTFTPNMFRGADKTEALYGMPGLQRDCAWCVIHAPNRPHVQRMP